MASKSNKIFSDKDFEKEPKEKKVKKTLLYGGIFAGVLAACGLSYAIFSGSDSNTPIDTPRGGTVVVDSAANKVPIDSTEVITPPAGEQEAVDVEQETTLSNQPTEVLSESVQIPEKVEEAAISVIRGIFGNNPERRQKLGDRYQEIQNKVNEMYRNRQVR